MSKLENAQKVVEFAKANGFPDASIYFYDTDGETGYTSIDTAVDELEDGEAREFKLGLDLCSVALENRLETVDGTQYSNGVEVQ